MNKLMMLVTLQVKSPALGAAVAALGLSNKAVYAEDLQDSNDSGASGMEGGHYTDGPDLAPNAAPAAVAGQLTTHCAYLSYVGHGFTHCLPAARTHLQAALSAQLWSSQI